jgi:S1-C subfamily serine protease
MRFSYFKADDHSFTVNQMQSEGVAEGDGVYVLGYPMGLVSTDWQAAICRQGCIARLQDTVVKGGGDFLIDAAVFPGNSGGPVILQPSAISISGTKQAQKANLIGVVQSYLPFQDEAVSLQTGRTRVVFDENSGLSPVIPVDRVNEVTHLALRRMTGRASTARRKAKTQSES